MDTKIHVRRDKKTRYLSNLRTLKYHTKRLPQSNPRNQKELHISCRIIYTRTTKKSHTQRLSL